MSDFLKKAGDFAATHDDKVDQGVEKAGDTLDERTGATHSDHIDRGVDEIQKRTGEGDTNG